MDKQDKSNLKTNFTKNNWRLTEQEIKKYRMDAMDVYNYYCIELDSSVREIIFKYFACEAMYYSFYNKYLILLEENGKKTQKQEVSIELVRNIFKNLGYAFDDNLLNNVYGSVGKKGDNNRSIKKLRNAVIHRMEPEAIAEIKLRYKELNYYLDEVIKCIIESPIYKKEFRRTKKEELALKLQRKALKEIRSSLNETENDEEKELVAV